jgi:alpha-tubulin suppressor-like RCC1 family protein
MTGRMRGPMVSGGEHEYCPCVNLTGTPSRSPASQSFWLRAGLCLALAAAVVTSSCSSAPRSSTGPSATASRLSAAKADPLSSGVVEHWGTFFGARAGVNYDTRTAPTAVTLPGPVAEIGTSNSTEYALLTNGRLYAWGLGTQGELGDGRTLNSFTRPVLVRFPRGVQIASIPSDVMPFNTALAVDTTGHVWGWGLNGGGELCLGNRKSYLKPVRLPFSNVTTLAGAANHAVYNADGTVYSCGQNLEGALGDGSRSNSTRPVLVAGLHGAIVTELVASFANSGALLSNGEYLDWGYNANGQLGDGRHGRPSDVPVPVDLPGPVSQIAQGGSIWGNGQTLVMLSDGELWSWGADTCYQLGNGTRGIEPSPVRFYPPAGVTYQSLATGSATSYAVSTTGHVYAWGVSFAGQVGNGLMATARTPVLVASRATAISATANNVLIYVSASL